MIKFIIGGYFLLLLFTLRMNTPVVKSQWAFLLRSFFPSWKFFQSNGHAPYLYARAANFEGEALHWSDWYWLYPRAERRWWHLFHNPGANALLARQTLVEHFCADLYDLPDGHDPRALVSYELVERHVRLELQEVFPEHRYFQFELRMVLEDGNGIVDSQVMMTSLQDTR